MDKESITDSHLVHKDKEKHKYVAKIDKGNKKYRYFYDKEEYQNYLKGKNVVGNLLSNIKVFNKKVKKSDVYKNYTKGKKAVEKTFKNLSSSIEKGKRSVEKVLNKNKDKRLNGIFLLYTKDQIEAIKDKVANAIHKITNKILPGKNKTKEETTNETNKTDHKYIAKVKLPNGKYRYFYDQKSYNAYLKRQEYQKNEPYFMKDISEIDESLELTDDQQMAEINKGYDPNDDARSMNCAYCTTAYEMRQRGYDVQASEFDEATYDAYPWGVYDWYENGDMEYISSTDGRTVNISEIVDHSSNLSYERLYDEIGKDDNVPYTASAIEKAIEENNPPNSRGNLMVYWEGGGGHSMAYEVDDSGKAIIRDCQTNKIRTFEQLVEIGVTDVSFMRTDNLEFTRKAMHTVEPKQ